jgi:hypothetical protein
VAPATIVLEITGDPDEVERFIATVRPFGIKEMMRTGRIAMTRGMTDSVLEKTQRRDSRDARRSVPAPSGAYVK